MKIFEFKTSVFDISKERENPINLIYGISLLQWLKEELKDTMNISEPDAEDWGWYSYLKYEGNNYLLGSSACTQMISVIPILTLNGCFKFTNNEHF